MFDKIREHLPLIIEKLKKIAALVVPILTALGIGASAQVAALIAVGCFLVYQLFG